MARDEVNLRTRKDKIAFLQAIKDGTRSINEVRSDTGLVLEGLYKEPDSVRRIDTGEVMTLEEAKARYAGRQLIVIPGNGRERKSQTVS